MPPSEPNQDPVQGEFFTAASDLPGRFVREATQNSLDARCDGQTVRVRFAFSGGSKALPHALIEILPEPFREWDSNRP